MIVSAMEVDPLVVNLRDPEFWQDPFPVWRAAADQGRTAQTTAGEVILLRSDDLDTAVTDPRFAQLGLGALERLGIHDGPFYQWRSHTMAAMDGPDHGRLRSSGARAFTPRRVTSFRNRLRKHAKGLLDAASEVGEIDIVADYAMDLPLWLICEFLGLPVEDRQEIDSFLAGTESGFADPMTSETRASAEEGTVALYGFVERLLAERARDPGEDLVSDLLEAEAGGLLDRDELLALVVNVIGGSVGSSRAGIANTILLMLRHPEQAAWVREDPDRMRGAVEECLRFQPPFRLGRRQCLERMEAFGLELAAGETVGLSRQAANRDPDRWEDPDRFDVTRAERRHYGFGYGAHFCLGQALARMDIQEVVRVFLDHCPDARLLDDDPRRVPNVPDDALVSLPVAIGSMRAAVV